MIYTAFLSYVRADDDNDDGRITELRRLLESEVRMQTGEDFPIFQDRRDILAGQRWQTCIEQSIDGTTLLIAIITPSYLRRDACREEWRLFREREHRLNRDDLIIPVLYVETPGLNDSDDPIARDLNSRQRFDWTIYRFEDFGSNQVRRGFAELASQITTAIERSRQSASEPIIPEEAPSGEDLGFLEVLAATEEAFPSLTITMTSLAETTEQISDLIAKATEEINSANSSGRPASARLSIVHRLSRRLEEPVTDMESLAEDFLDQVTQVGSGISLFIDRVPFFDQEELEAAGSFARQPGVNATLFDTNV